MKTLIAITICAFLFAAGSSGQASVASCSSTCSTVLNQCLSKAKTSAARSNCYTGYNSCMSNC